MSDTPDTPIEHPAVVTIPWTDLLQLREALLVKVIWAQRTDDVVEVNKALNLADIHLDLDSPMTRLCTNADAVRVAHQRPSFAFVKGPHEPV